MNKKKNGNVLKTLSISQLTLFSHLTLFSYLTLNGLKGGK